MAFLIISFNQNQFKDLDVESPTYIRMTDEKKNCFIWHSNRAYDIKIIDG